MSDCLHQDIQFFPEHKGAVACMDCGRLFGHLRDETFTAHNPATERPEPPETEDGFQHCVYCGADCQEDYPEHADSCPSNTGVYPVREDDFGPKCIHCGEGAFGGMCCVDCGAELKIGDHYMHREVVPGDPLLPGLEGASVNEVICIGCKAKDSFE